jgi:hypothetical protein
MGLITQAIQNQNVFMMQEKGIKAASGDQTLFQMVQKTHAFNNSAKLAVYKYLKRALYRPALTSFVWLRTDPHCTSSW